MDYIGEWTQAKFRIPNKEYHQLQKVFNPIYFNAEEWVLLAKEAGMKYITVTSKHHEGFALFDTKVSNFNSVKSPFGRDIIAELAEACYKHNFGLGLYYSQAVDWSHPDGGGYGALDDNCGMSWCNDWDFPDASIKNFDRCFEEKTLPQVTELMKNYGDIALVWFDTPRDISPEQSSRLYELVKKYQPDCLINSRIGNGYGDYRSGGDNELDMKGDGMLCESPTTLNKTWGFKYFDDEWKDAKTVIEIKNRLNSSGVNYLVNVGPDGLGRFPAPAIDILREVGRSL